MKNVMTTSLIALAMLVSSAPAGNHNSACCNQCGCGVRKVCRMKCEMKDVTTYRYCAKCEDFCLPGPSKCCGSKLVCDCQALCGVKKQHLWQPTCGHMCHKKMLVKIPVTKKVPVYTCEVVCICNGCGCAQVDEAATAEARANQIMPVSAEEPLVLEDNTQPASADDQASVADTAPVKQASLMERVFGR